MREYLVVGGGVGFTAYEDGEASDIYSTAHMAQVTLGDVIALPVPRVLRAGEVTFLGWSDTIPTGTLEALNPTIVIPCPDDTKEFLTQQNGQFKKGMRSVIVQYQGKFTCFVL